ncbi:hypothetical protein BB561_001762 [Smittium simulii]|uniref:Uncharacterized protein n=1 Tax=Smittium simulii TaxID=133385 RepID=A0A2T9YT77_9FUNG|nr:hypothetical protein BB561_001762 [Smittium simulii]
MLNPVPHKIYQTQASVAKFTLERARYWAPSVAGWGVFAGLTVMLLVSDVPLVRKDIMSKIPHFGKFWAVEESE